MSSTAHHIPVPELFSFKECVWFLDRNFDDCMQRIEDGRVTKVISVNGAMVLISVAENKGALKIAIPDTAVNATSAELVIAYVKEWFDMERNLQPFYRLLRTNACLAYMADEFEGLRVVSIPDLFEALCWAVIGQQINLTFAYRLKRRLVEKYGGSLVHDGIVYYSFPTSESLAGATMDDLQAMQFSSQKAAYLIGIGKAFLSGTISKDHLYSLPDFLARQKALTAMKGIGIWSANYALMKSLREPGGVPHGDAGLLNALMKHGIIKEKTDGAAIEYLFKQFSGWESYLVFYLWRSLSMNKSVDQGRS